MPQLLPTSQQLRKSLIAFDHLTGQLPTFSLQAYTVRFCFVVCPLLYAVLSLQDVFACTVRVAHVYMCVGHGTDPQIRLGQ